MGNKVNTTFDSNQLIGLSEKEAKELAIKNGFAFRVTRKGNVNYIITCDFRVFRINVELDDNEKVTKVDFG